MARQTWTNSNTVSEVLGLDGMVDDNQDELYAVQTEVTNARDGKSTLLAQIDEIQADIVSLEGTQSSGLPALSGNSGKWLTNNGVSTVSWTNTITESSYIQQADNDTATGNIELDYSDGDMIQLTATGTITFTTPANFPTGEVCSMVIDAVNFGDQTINHHASWLFAGGATPVYTSSGTDRVLLMKDKDDIYTLHVIGLNIRAVS